MPLQSHLFLAVLFGVDLLQEQQLVIDCRHRELHVVQGEAVLQLGLVMDVEHVDALLGGNEPARAGLVAVSVIFGHRRHVLRAQAEL